MNTLKTTFLMALLTVLPVTLGGALMSLFFTHPPMAERVARLQEMSRMHSY